MARAARVSTLATASLSFTGAVKHAGFDAASSQANYGEGFESPDDVISLCTHGQPPNYRRLTTHRRVA
jgi:hypothetical protein